MRFLKDRVKLIPLEMRDPKTRKAVFREAGKTYTKSEGDLTDRPGAIAQLMEMAFNAGIAHSSEAPPSVDANMHDIDVPSLSREIFEDFRRFKVGLRPRGQSPILEQYALSRQGGSGVQGRLGRDRWLGWGDRSDSSRSKKAIGPLLKLGLFEEADFLLPDGTKADGVIITEWGVELLLTGATAKIGQRINGRSTTYPTYLALKGHNPLPQKNGMISVWDLEASAAAFILDHRINGIGRAERLEGGACLEDLSYFLEVIPYSSFQPPIKNWRLFRPYFPQSMPLFDRSVEELLDVGILLAEGNDQMLISEWGYELICTGATAAPDNRIEGESSTYHEYQTVVGRHFE